MDVAMIKLGLNLHVELPIVYADSPDKEVIVECLIGSMHIPTSSVLSYSSAPELLLCSLSVTGGGLSSVFTPK